MSLILQIFHFYCRLKAYIVLTFWTLSRISSANSSNFDQSWYTCRGQGPTTFMKFRARLAKWGRNRGLKSVPDARVFLSAIADDFSATSQRPIFAKFGHDTWIVGETQILDRNLRKASILGSFAPKPQTWRGSNRHLTQSRLQAKGCTAERYCLLCVVVQGPGSFRGRSTFCTTYGCGATGHQNCQIFGFWPIFPIQNP